jgi:hypothetical protein
MTAYAASAPAARRHEWLFTGLLAAAAALVVVLVGPAGGDVPAHLYRTLLVRENVYLWDNLWFAGQYPLVSYSLLYYPVAAVTGNVVLVIASVVAAAVLFERICAREWGAASVWPARAFAVLAAGPLFTGTYSYAAGFATLLATVAALQSGRVWIAVGCGALTLGFSPLAFIFLVIVLAAVAVSRRRVMSRKAVLFAAGMSIVVGVELAALRLFPTGGAYPFRGIELATVLVVAGLGVIIASRAPRGGVLAALFGFWLLSCIALFLIPGPVGENVTRLRSVVFPLMLLTVLVARFRPRWVAVLGLTLALAYNVVPYANAVSSRIDSRASDESFWTPALQYLRDHRGGAFRVEVVPTADHWEAWWIPSAGFPLARGWYRQMDIAENGALYRDPLSPAGYRHWLRRMAVRYVMLPSLTLGKKGADREARLLLNGVDGLRLVYHTATWRIWEVSNAAPIATGPGRVHMGAFKHDRIAMRFTEPGTYRLAVRYMPYWEVKRGAVCVRQAADGMTLLDVRRAGRLLLAAADGPSALVRSPLSDSDDRCR